MFAEYRKSTALRERHPREVDNLLRKPEREWVESLAMTEAVSNTRRIGLMDQPEIARRRRLAKRATAIKPLPRSARLAGSGVCTEVVKSNDPPLPPLSAILVCDSRE